MEKLKSITKGQWIVAGVIIVIIAVLSMVSASRKTQIDELKAQAQVKSDSLLVALRNVGELQTTIKQMQSNLKQCENENVISNQETSKWKLRYYEQKALQQDCETAVDRAVLNNTAPDLQGLILANRLISGKTGGFRLVVPPNPDNSDQ